MAAGLTFGIFEIDDLATVLAFEQLHAGFLLGSRFGANLGQGLSRFIPLNDHNSRVEAHETT